MAVKRKEGEDLSADNVSKIISLLEGDKPITKKDACSMLKISYNTSRLNKIIEEFHELNEYRAKQRKILRYKKVEDVEIKEIVSDYLSGESLTIISETTFRSIGVIKRLLAQYNIPLRDASSSYFKPLLLEDGTWKEDYISGDLVYSSRYSRPCTIIKLIQVHEVHGNCYQIQLHGTDRFVACQPAYELADLTEVQQKFQIVLEDMSGDDVKRLLYEAYLKSKKMDTK
jgi:hypothetical protein